VTLLVLACGKSERDGTDENSAGTKPQSEAGSSSVSSGGTAGAVSTGGATVGGSSAGGVTGGGIGGVASAGESPEPTDAGAPAVGGAPGCTGYYPACGCGCCGGLPHAASCVYPDLGQDLTEVAAQDAERRQGGGCALAGCSLGMDYFCCAAPPAVADNATYEASVFIGGINRLRLHKQSKDCSTVELQQTSPADPADPAAFPLTLPAGFKVESIRTLPCSSSAIGPAAIGAIGSFKLRIVGEGCVVDAHLTAFFTNDARELRTVRFDAEGVLVDRELAECK
jgi:hypothetical protein